MQPNIQVVVQDESSQVVIDDSLVTVVSAIEERQVVVSDTASIVITVGEQGPPGAGASVEYTRATPMAITVGGAGQGTTFSGAIENALDTILYPYQTPAFSAFSFPQTNPIEVGDTVASGSKSFSWAFTNIGNVAANTLEIDDLTNALTLGSSLAIASPTSLAITAVTKTSATSHSYRVYATDSQAAVFNRDFTINWYWRTCYGESTLTALTSPDILALRVTGLSNTINGTKAFVGGGYKYVCYPTTFGLKTTFKDIATNLDVAMVGAATVPVTNSFGVTQAYYVHRTLNVLGGAINVAIS